MSAIESEFSYNNHSRQIVPVLHCTCTWTIQTSETDVSNWTPNKHPAFMASSLSQISTSNTLVAAKNSRMVKGEIDVAPKRPENGKWSMRAYFFHANSCYAFPQFLRQHRWCGRVGRRGRRATISSCSHWRAAADRWEQWHDRPLI